MIRCDRDITSEWFAANVVQKIRVGRVNGYQYRARTQGREKYENKKEGKKGKK